MITAPSFTYYDEFKFNSNYFSKIYIENAPATRKKLPLNHFVKVRNVEMLHWAAKNNDYVKRGEQLSPDALQVIITKPQYEKLFREGLIERI